MLVFGASPRPSKLNFLLGWIRIATEKDRHITDAVNEMAICLLGELRRQGFLLLLKLVELNFDELQRIECVVHVFEEIFTQSGLADFHCRIEMLSESAQLPDLLICKWFHLYCLRMIFKRRANP